MVAAAATFGAARRGGVVAWDNSGDPGGEQPEGGPGGTPRDLLAAIADHPDPGGLGVAELGRVVRAQGNGCFDLLAGGQDPDSRAGLAGADFEAVHSVLRRFYRLILIDVGDDATTDDWLAAAMAADLLVVTASLAEDSGYRALRMLDELQTLGYPNLKYQTVTVLSDAGTRAEAMLVADLVHVFTQRTRAVCRVPHDPRSPGATPSWLPACAAMAAAL